MIITTYAGKSNNTGEFTKKTTWQENRKLISYVDEIKEALGNVNLEFYKKCIVIRKPERIVESSDIIKTKNGSIIKRSKYDVGKDIGDCIYIKTDYVFDVMDKKMWFKFLEYLNNNENWNKVINRERGGNILKIKKDFSSVTLINSPDFDISEEPYIKNWLKVDLNNKKTIYGESNPENPPIYHHKWLFVKDNYDGFNVESSKRRSKLWLSLSGIDFSRIGYKKYWEENVVPRIEKIRNKTIDPFDEENWEYGED